MRHPTGVEQHTCSSSNDSLSRLIPERKPTRQNQLAGESGGIKPEARIYVGQKFPNGLLLRGPSLYARGGVHRREDDRCLLLLGVCAISPPLFPPFLLRLLFFTDWNILFMQRRSHNSKINIKHCICSVREGTTDNATPHPSSTMEGEEGRGTLGTTLSQPTTDAAYISCRCYLPPRGNDIRRIPDVEQPPLVLQANDEASSSIL